MKHSTITIKPFTKQQQKVLWLSLMGMTNAQIARHLGLSGNRIGDHRQAVRRKLYPIFKSIYDKGHVPKKRIKPKPKIDEKYFPVGDPR